jgi:hypothetical protein
MTTVRLRDDLAEEELLVPAWKGWKGWHEDTASEHEGTLAYLDKADLDGAINLGDLYAKLNWHPSHNLNRIKLKDGRVFFMLGVDLDWDHE